MNTENEKREGAADDANAAGGSAPENNVPDESTSDARGEEVGGEDKRDSSAPDADAIAEEERPEDDAFDGDESDDVDAGNVDENDGDSDAASEAGSEAESRSPGAVRGGDFRAGYVAIVGEPNVGKSTLMNALIGTKLSIVTPKPQTTRKSVLGILTTDEGQMIFIDTPGVLSPRYLLQEKLAGYVIDAVRDADVILLMLDVTDPSIERLATTPLGDVRDLGKPIVLLLNKMDVLHDKKVALPLIQRFTEMGAFVSVIPASGLYAMNVVDLVKVITQRLPKGEPFYDPEVVSEQPERFFASELIREQILELYRQEIPYSVEVDIIEFKERPQPEKIYIAAEIVVERDTQKGIVIGKGGEALKKLGSRARRSIEEFLGRGVFLELFVKVRRDWRSSESRLRSFGY